jgi:hypothetical protein
MSTVFREPKSEMPVAEEPQEKSEKIQYGHEEDVESYRPIETDQDILRTLGIQDDIKVLPKEDFDNLQELKSYFDSYMAEKGLPKTAKGYQRAIEKIKDEVGLDQEADPQALIEKVGGIAKAWKEISFVKDFEEKKRILIKLVSASSQKDMDNIIFSEMNKRKIWQS